MVRLAFWYDFASTYSYPAAMRISECARQRGISVDWHPFLLGPIFAAQGWTDSPFNLYPAKGRHMWRDLARLCTVAGLPLHRPAQFPQNSLLAARVALTLDGDDRARFSRSVFSIEFGEGRNIESSETIAAILAQLDLPAAAILEHAASENIRKALRSNGEAAKRLDLFGAPSFVTGDGELFWGYDRMEAALDRAAGHQQTL